MRDQNGKDKMVIQTAYSLKTVQPVYSRMDKSVV